MTIGFTPYLWMAGISFLLRAALMNMARLYTPPLHGENT